MRKKTKLVRVDEKVWNNVEQALPNMNNPQRSKLLYDFSIVKTEKMLKDIDFKNALGVALYGNAWKKTKRK